MPQCCCRKLPFRPEVLPPNREPDDDSAARTRTRLVDVEDPREWNADDVVGSSMPDPFRCRIGLRVATSYWLAEPLRRILDGTGGLWESTLGADIGAASIRCPDDAASSASRLSSDDVFVTYDCPNIPPSPNRGIVLKFLILPLFSSQAYRQQSSFSDAFDVMFSLRFSFFARGSPNRDFLVKWNWRCPFPLECPWILNRISWQKLSVQKKSCSQISIQDELNLLVLSMLALLNGWLQRLLAQTGLSQ